MENKTKEKARKEGEIQKLKITIQNVKRRAKNKQQSNMERLTI